MKHKLLSLFVGSMILTSVAFAQEKKISGRVTGSDGKPLAGVTVVVQGTNVATQTDANGNYSLSTASGKVIVFHSVGYTDKTLIVKEGQNAFNIILEDVNNALEEVIVTAYGTQTKESVAGSIATLKAKDLGQVQSANVVQSLSGKVGGVQIRSTTGQPGAAATVRFRGLGSISSSNDPLYVVDGVPFNGDIASISSQDIEEISFLKDASANALYGSRGANGVIIITTKKGKNTDKVDISLDSRVGFNSRATKDYDYITDPGEYYELRWQRLRLGEIVLGENDADARAYATENLVNDLGYNIFNVANNKIVDPKTGKLYQNASVKYQDHWNDYLFKNSIRHEHNLNFKYGNDKVSSYLSGGYLKDNGYVVNSGFDRVSARGNLEFRPYQFMKVGGNVNFASTKARDPQSGKGSATYSNLFSWSRNQAPIYPIFARDKNGNILKNAAGREIYDWGRGETTNPDGTEAKRPYITNMNPYASTLLDRQTNNNTNVSLRTFASFDFFKHFNFTYNLGYDFRAANRLRYGNTEGGDAQPYGGSITNALNHESTLTNQQLLSYDNTFGDHKLNIMIGHESSNYMNKMLAGSKTSVVIPESIFITNASKYSFLDGFNDIYKVEGYLSKLNYSYLNKYYLNASFRRDGSSVFHPDYRWGNFYGIGGAWVVSNEEFLKSNSTISNLKLKISYGEQGNDNLYYPGYVSMDHRNHFGFSRNYYPYMDQFEIRADAQGDPAVKQVYTGTQDLKWEVSRNFNTGFDLSLFKNRLNVEFEFFIRKVSDMLYNFPQAPSSGIPAISKNIGDMKNTGFELAINGDVIKTDDWNLNLWANATHYKNKITRLPKPFVNDGIFRFVEGESAYTYYLREFAGVNPETGNGKWYVGEKDPLTAKATGEKTTTETYTQGTQYLSNKTANPDIYGGFGLDLRYKKLSFNAGFAYQLGGYIFDGVYQGLFSEGTGMGSSGANYHKDIYNTWTPENKNATMPILSSENQTQYNSSDMFLMKANYISLENVGISYDISNKTFDKAGIKNARLSLLGSNLFMLSKRRGLDPRMMQLGGELNNGLTLNSYSLLRSVSFGLTVNF
ncbi:SusC/RagA family TonB-linked outer membrane protein [Sphingobacterium sp.]|uniref:SusC/RagA family TonB-linked outer membrane protein n=1 Tax=Sphingobacterium sp. TaxID=341027 RepID=UPI0031D6D61F